MYRDLIQLFAVRSSLEWMEPYVDGLPRELIIQKSYRFALRSTIEILRLKGDVSRFFGIASSDN